MMADETIMIVEDDIISAEALRDKLIGFGYAVLPPLDKGHDAVRRALETFPDLVLMDIKLSGPMDGIAAASAIQKKMDIPVVYMTAYTDDEILQRARITAPYSYLVKPLRDRELQITIEMVLHRYQLESRLKDRERWLDTVLRSIGDAVVATDHNGRVNFMNPVAENLSGWTFGEAAGKPVDDILKLTSEKTGEPAENPVSKVIREGRVVGLANHTILVAKDGTRLAVDDSAASVMDENGRLTGAVMVFRDVTRRRGLENELERHRGRLEELVAERTKSLVAEIAEREKTENRLQQEIDFRRTIIDNMAEGLCVWEAIDAWPFIRISLWNRCMADITGYTMDEINQKGCFECLYPHVDERDRLRKQLDHILAGQPLNNHEHEIVCADGNRRTVLLSASSFEGPQGQKQVLCLTRDITQLKRAEQERDRLGSQLRQAQKMEAIGTLAGGIAHDFNNILGVILGCTELSMMEASQTSSLARHLKQVMAAGRRAADLVQQILTFSRQRELDRQPLRLDLVVKEVGKMLRATLPSFIEIRQEIQQDAGMVLADPAQMHQLVMNLGTNAAHAMQESGGVLRILLQKVEIDSVEADALQGVIPGAYLKLTVSDTGYGMDHITRERIFDPYFTTKNPEEGTGLGLAVVMGIVKDCGGAITVWSQPGQGARFDVYLPPVDDAVPSDRPEPLAETLPTGTEEILFVDDEKELGDIAGNMLRWLGYRVHIETDSLEALRRFKEDPQRFDLVISDVTMPRMTGDHLALELMHIRPELPIILCTGFSHRLDGMKAKAIGVRGFIKKPMSIEHLAVTIRTALDG